MQIYKYTLNVKQFLSYSVKIGEIIVKKSPSISFIPTDDWVRPMKHIYLNI